MQGRSADGMILYRPVGLQELALIYDSGMTAFPARLPQQPIFYPVLDLAYARQIASEWNAASSQAAGYVTQFKVEEDYIGRFEPHPAGESRYQEFWIPAGELEDFNRHIGGHIKVVEAHFGDAFEGFIPEGFGLKGKNAVEQFSVLANDYLYRRMDFYLEIKRNHKAVFLNYPFWQRHGFKDPGLKEKVLQAIKEAWLASFPRIPLPLPPPETEDTPHPEPPDSAPSVGRQEISQAGQRDPYSPGNPADEEETPAERSDPEAWEEGKTGEGAGPGPLAESEREDDVVLDQKGAHFVARPADRDAMPVTQTDPHTSKGLELGFGGRYREAIEELSKALEEDPGHIVAHVSLGVAFHRLGEEDRALSSYEAALRIDPIYAEAHYFRADILYRQGNVREAIAGYTIAIGLDPGLIEAHRRPAPVDRLTAYSGTPAEMHWIARPARRILELDKALESSPGQASLVKERAAEYARLGNYVQAIVEYGAFLEKQPGDANVYHLRGVAFEHLGRSDRAREDYRRAIAIDPQLANLYIDRGVNFGKTGNFRQSIESFTEAIRLAPDNPDGYFNRGTAYLQHGDLEKAIQDYSDVIRLSPGDEEAYYRRGIAHEQAGHAHEAIADYRQFLALSRDASARREIEQKLVQWNAGRQEGSPKPDQGSPEQPGQALDLYGLILALGERARASTWFASGVEGQGEKAEELYTLTAQDRPVEGGDFLSVMSGIRRTSAGDFQAFDPGGASPWIFIRAWEGDGFYIETDDPSVKQQLMSRFPSAEGVEGASPPYQGLFVRV